MSLPTMSPSAPELELDSVLAGRYRVGPVLRHGRAGVTYAALDTQLGRKVCVAGAVQDRQAFLDLAQVRARLEHPNVVRVWAAFEEGGVAYVVTERVAGPSLADELRRRRAPFSQAEAAEIIGQVAVAVRVAAAAGVVGLAPSVEDVLRADDGRAVLADLAPGAGSLTGAPVDGIVPIARLLHVLVTGRVPGPLPVPAWRVNPTVSRAASDALAAVLGGAHNAPQTTDDLLIAFGLALDPTLAWRPAVIDVREPALGEMAAAETSEAEAEVELTEIVPAAEPDVEASTVHGGPHLTVPFDPAADLDAWDGTVLVAPVEVAPVEVAPPEVTEPVTGLRSTVGSRRAPSVAADGPVPFVAHVPAPLRVEPRAPAPIVRRTPPALGALVPACRPWLTAPLAAAALALASAAPAFMLLALALGVAPLLATRGDQLARPDRSVAWLPARWVRNVVVGALRGVMPGVVLLFGLLLWWGTGIFDSMDTVGEVILRVTGVIVGWALVRSIGRGAPTFRSHLALDDLAVRLMPAGRPTPVIAGLVLACLGLVAVGLSFTPETWPFPS